MKDLNNLAAMIDVRPYDRVHGWFGEAIVTDVAHGYLTDQITDEQIGSVDDMVRIQQENTDGSLYFTYVYKSDITRNYTAEESILRG